MARLGVIDRLPKDVREQIAALRDAGRTIDEILCRLEDDGVILVRSTLGLHVKKLDELGAKLREKRVLAEALVRQYGDGDVPRVLALNVELMHGVLMDLLSGEDGQQVVLDPQSAMFVATALQKLSTASKTDADFRAKVEEQAATRATKAAADRAEQAIVRQGVTLSADKLQAIRQEIYGIVG